MREFHYAAVNRPVDVNTAPNGFTCVLPRPEHGKPHHFTARHGILVYERELTDDETNRFELARIIEGDDLVVLANQAAKALDAYAKRWLEAKQEMNEADFFDAFQRSLHSKLKRIWQGHPPSISDFHEFAQHVVVIMDKNTNNDV